MKYSYRAIKQAIKIQQVKKKGSLTYSIIQWLEETLGCADQAGKLGKGSDKSSRCRPLPKKVEIKKVKECCVDDGPCHTTTSSASHARSTETWAGWKDLYGAVCVYDCLRSLSVSLDVFRLSAEVTQRWQGSNNPHAIKFNLTPLRQTHTQSWPFLIPTLTLHKQKRHFPWTGYNMGPKLLKYEIYYDISLVLWCVWKKVREWSCFTLSNKMKNLIQLKIK